MVPPSLSPVRAAAPRPAAQHRRVDPSIASRISAAR